MIGSSLWDRLPNLPIGVLRRRRHRDPQAGHVHQRMFETLGMLRCKLPRDAARYSYHQAAS